MKRQESRALFGVGKPETYIRRIEKIHKKMREQRVYNKFLYIPIFQWISLEHFRKNPEFVQSVLDDSISTYHSTAKYIPSPVIASTKPAASPTNSTLFFTGSRTKLPNDTNAPFMLFISLIRSVYKELHADRETGC